MGNAMNLRELADASEKLRGEVGDEAMITGIGWWNGTWEVRIIAYVLRQSGIREPESQTWDLVRGTRVA